MRGLSLNVFTILFLIFLNGCATNTPEIRKTINQPSNMGNKIIKGLTTKEEVLKLFGRRPDYLVDLKEHCKFLQAYIERLELRHASREYIERLRKDFENSQYYDEKWTYVFEKESIISKVLKFIDAEIFYELGEAISKTYDLTIYFDNKGIVQDYRLDKR